MILPPNWGKLHRQSRPDRPRLRRGRRRKLGRLCRRSLPQLGGQIILKPSQIILVFSLRP